MDRPNLEAFLVFLEKKKTEKKLTVVLWCQIVDRNSVAPSSGDLQQRPAPPIGKIRNFDGKKTFSKKIDMPLLRPWPDFREGKCCGPQEKVRRKVLLGIFLKIQNSF